MANGFDGLTAGFWATIDQYSTHPALITTERDISYSELCTQADNLCAELRLQLPDDLTRPLMLIEAVNTPASIIAYIGALRAEWPVILVAAGTGQPGSQIYDTYRPNIVYRQVDGIWQMNVTDAQPAPLHPDLAVLLSTSGTTGAAKLVRLSRQNIAANAASIATYLDARPEDRAITLLPFHYSYGLSVLHVQLQIGGALVLTEGSLIDQEVRELALQKDVTSLSMVPTQFELLDDLSWLPRLRYITQAGGRIDPQIAARFAALATADDWQFYIMYGQTEAGPRIAYLPPEDAAEWSSTIGKAIPGGKLWIEDDAGQPIPQTGQSGQLVYQGANVMLGYAETREELADPAGPDTLRTGDMAERLGNGYFRITGRASRFIKLFGLRIGLDEVETQLRESGVKAYVSGTDQHLAIFVPDAAEVARLRTTIADRYGLPQSTVAVATLSDVPLLPSGKVDYRALQALAQSMAPENSTDVQSTEAVLGTILRREELDLDTSFVDHGGDSLSYLEVQMHLIDRLGTLPEHWETRPLRDVIRMADSAKRETGGPVERARFQPISADLIGRVMAITAIVMLHTTPWPTGGGTYLLLILVGFSLARFQSSVLFRGNIWLTLRSMLLPIIVCYFVLIGALSVVFGDIEPQWYLLYSNFEYDAVLKGLYPYWFVSLYVQLILLFVVPFTIPAVREFVARVPLQAGLGALLILSVATWLTGMEEMTPHARHRTPLASGALVALGWSMYYAKTTRQKLVVSVAVLGLWALNWGDLRLLPSLFLIAGSGAVIWSLSLPVPRILAQATTWVGSLSLFVYLTHTPIISVATKYTSLPVTFKFLLVFVSSLISAALLKEAYNRADALIARYR